jgi:hypothetical protein
MAALTGTTDTYALKGAAEDFHNAIYDISPTDCPVMAMAKRFKASATQHNWQTDSLASASVNKFVEGDDATFASASPTTVLSNRTMISQKTVIVSRTADSVRKYGRAKELARLVTKYGRELKRDIETAFVGNQGSSAGSATVARQAAGLRSMSTNYVRPTGTAVTAGTVPGYATGGSSDWTVSSDSTASTLTEVDLRGALEEAWTDGGDATKIVVNSKQKRRIALMGGATAFTAGGYTVSGNQKQQGVVVGGIDVYISDFGEHTVILDRFLGQTAVLCLDPEYVGIAFLDNIKIEDLAKTGDAEKKMIVTEYTFVAQNPNAHGQVIGCTLA